MKDQKIAELEDPSLHSMENYDWIKGKINGIQIQSTNELKVYSFLFAASAFDFF